MIRTKVIVSVVLLASGFYVLTIGWRAFALIRDGRPVALVLGVGVVTLSGLVGWAVAREVRFGFAAQRLARILHDEGGLVLDDLPRRPSGRVIRSAADADFPRYRRDVECHPEQWRAWFRLATAYDVSGDRRRARSAMYRAIALSKGELT